MPQQNPTAWCIEALCEKDAGCCRTQALLMNRATNGSAYLVEVTKPGELVCVEWLFSNTPPLSKRPCKMGEAAGLYYPWTGFHRAETHALPHSSSLHNWKHLGMKIESRWHINGCILQGHADKKSLLLLTGGCWPSLKETAGDWMLSHIQKALVDQWSGAFSGTVQSQQISSPASTTKPFLLPSLASQYVQVERRRVSAAQHKETCVKLYPSAGSMNGNPSLWTLITQLLWLFYQCLLHEYNFCTHREQFLSVTSLVLSGSHVHTRLTRILQHFWNKYDRKLFCWHPSIISKRAFIFFILYFFNNSISISNDTAILPWIGHLIHVLKTYQLFSAVFLRKVQ